MVERPPSEMLERVGAALMEANGAIVRDYGSGNCPVEVAYYRLARAAVEAMRDPIRDDRALTFQNVLSKQQINDVNTTFNRVIDAALNP